MGKIKISSPPTKVRWFSFSTCTQLALRSKIFAITIISKTAITKYCLVLTLYQRYFGVVMFISLLKNSSKQRNANTKPSLNCIIS